MSAYLTGVYARQSVLKRRISLFFILAAAVLPTLGHAAPGNALARGMTLIEQGCYEKAQHFFQRVTARHPKNAEAAADLAKAYLANEQNELGAQWAEKAASLQPDNVHYQILLGDAKAMYVNDVSIFSKLGIAGDIKTAYLKAVQLAPQSVEAHFSLAMFYMVAPGIAGGSNDKARKQISELLKLDPAQANMAAAMMAKIGGNKTRAIRLLRRAANYDNKSADGEMALGMHLTHHHQPKAAIKLFNAAIRKNPKSSVAYYEIGKLAALGHGNAGTGLRALKHYLHMQHDWNEPPFKGAYYRMGMIDVRKNNKTAARAAYRKALKLDPHFKQAHQALSKLGSR
jgi:tetratricopeptide (TPR) repeat protein